MARTALRAWLAGDGLHKLEDEVVLVASELVTNALVHVGTAMELTYAALHGRVEIAIRDYRRRSGLDALPSPVAVPEASSTVPLPVGGRGLAIVAALADEWG